MEISRRRVVLLTILALLLIRWVAAQSTIAGAYTCHGDQAGTPYTLYLTVAPLGETYHFGWSEVQDGDPYLVGLGLREADWIAVAMVDLTTRAVGTSIYHVARGTLVGYWTRGDGTRDMEVCTVGVGRPKAA